MHRSFGPQPADAQEEAEARMELGQSSVSIPGESARQGDAEQSECLLSAVVICQGLDGSSHLLSKYPSPSTSDSALQHCYF